MARLKFGAFLAPHHPIGEHPMLQMRNDIRFAAHLDALGYDEFWVGEHTREVLAEIGYSGDEIEAIFAAEAAA